MAASLLSVRSEESVKVMAEESDLQTGDGYYPCALLQFTVTVIVQGF